MMRNIVCPVFSYKSCIFVFVISSVMATNVDNKKQIMEGDIVPVVDEAPSAKLTVIYNGNKEVEFGGELTPTEVKDQPTLVKFEADPDKYYLLGMVDPDVPDPAKPEVNHWLVGNIKGGDLSTGDVITEYRGSGPPKGTGLHRYIFLVFEQNGKIEFDWPRTAADSREHRLQFKLRAFTKKYNMSKPIAGNYFKAQWDPYVDERKKQTEQ